MGVEWGTGTEKKNKKYLCVVWLKAKVVRRPSANMHGYRKADHNTNRSLKRQARCQPLPRQRATDSSSSSNRSGNANWIPSGIQKEEEELQLMAQLNSALNTATKKKSSLLMCSRGSAGRSFIMERVDVKMLTALKCDIAREGSGDTKTLTWTHRV